jgi:hypothetical protein
MQDTKYLDTIVSLQFCCSSETSLDLKSFAIYYTEKITENAFFTLFEFIYIKDKPSV